MDKNTDSTRRLPIKIVIPQEQDLSSKPPSGGPRKKHLDISPKEQSMFLQQISVIREHFSPILTQGVVPVVARVVLKEDALAKSYRPVRLLSNDTCPVIGGEIIGSLLISVCSDGLSRLEDAISHKSTKGFAQDLATISRFEPYTVDNAVGELGVDGLANLIKAEKLEKIKIKLFRHRKSQLNQSVYKAFLTLIKQLELKMPEQLHYAKNTQIYRLRNVTPRKVKKLASFAGTQNLSPFPQFGLFSQYLPQGTASETCFPKPDPRVNYPLVGVIDSGTDPNNKLLRPWVEIRDEKDVPAVDQDNNHGSFVAGLIANGRILNHGDERFPSAQARIIDVVCMPKKGTPVDEDDLIKTIRRAIVKYPEAKVWNLSISKVNDRCRDEVFSDFAIALDSIQEEFDVTFSICAGNYDKPPFRGWNPPDDLGEDDRIYPPADSIHAVTVGAIAHNEHTSTCVNKLEPSPFSRRGPGAAFIPKPDVCHIGGNCDKTGDCRQVGVLSLDGSGNVAEAIGTSFSTPLVSTILANIRAGVSDPISRNLAKALLIQSAAISSEPVLAKDLPYRGFGVPGEISDILTCAPWQATLVFEPKLPPHRKVFAKTDFPIPACFRRNNSTIEGEFLMTLVYDPPCDPMAGAEYCRVNVDVSLGTYDIGKNGKPKHSKQIPLEPKDYSKLYEKHLVEHGFKWSPVKVFRRKLSRTSGTRWRLMIELLYRSEFELAKPQGAALVVTMFDPERKKPVYDDVLHAMNASGWIIQDLRVDERIRTRSEGG